MGIMLGSLATIALTVIAASPVPFDSAPRDTLVLAHEFTAPSEFTRVTLEAGQVYRVELTDGTAIQVRTLLPGEQNPIVARTETYPRASRTVVFELAPSVTTVYEIRVGGITRGAAPLRVYWDQHSTARRQKVIEGVSR
jgi:hypothetical protein